jgi:hypothetical protein
VKDRLALVVRTCSNQKNTIIDGAVASGRNKVLVAIAVHIERDELIEHTAPAA